MKRNILAIGILAMVVTVFGACTRTKGDAYKDYMKGGEIVYPGRVDTILVLGGYKKARLRVALGNDPLVRNFRAYWNNQQDSVTVLVDHTKDTVDVTIENLLEGNYNFTVHTFDAEGHKSVVSIAYGSVYGDGYIGSLTNRTLRSVTQSKDGLQIVLTWGDAIGGELGTEVQYTGADGTVRVLPIPVGAASTTLPDYKPESKLTWKSLYKPDPTAFENFSPAAGEVTLPPFERQFDKNKFALVILPTDVLDGGYGWLQEFMWNENYNPPGFATQSKVPCWFTVDAGGPAALSRFTMWQANDRLFQKESVKTFELYGSNSPASDGTWASWTQIGGVYTSVKPSGSPVGTNTQADIDYAKAGEKFNVPAGTPAFRYYRFKLLSNWGNSGFMTLEEFTLFTRDK